MQHQNPFRYVLVLCFFLWVLVPAHAQQARINSLTFIENRGQIVDTDGKPRPDIAYSASSGEMNVYFTSSGVSYVFVQSQETRSAHTKKPLVLAAREVERTIRTWRVDMELMGMRGNARILPEEQTTEYFNYYYAHCPNGITKVPSYRRLVYSNVYDNIDLVFYENGQTLKYDFVVRPGGRVSDIQFRYQGAERVKLTRDGTLMVKTPLGDLQELAPVSYQSTSGVEFVSALSQNGVSPVTSRFLHTKTGFGFDVDSYEPTQTLVIDPDVQWSTFLGADGNDEAGYGIAIDNAGDIILSGETASINFPVSVGAEQVTRSGATDAFVVKLDEKGQRRWATFYGGSASDNAYGGVAVDNSRSIAVTGYTTSNDFPVTDITFQKDHAGGTDVFILYMDAEGRRNWSTLYGGRQDDYGYATAFDNDGSIICSGRTESNNFPISSNAFQTNYGGGNSDCFLLKFMDNGQREWATYFGGNNYYDMGFDVAVDTENNIVMSGSLGSGNVEMSANALQRFYGGGVFDIFIAKFASDGGRQWATYLGGNESDEGVGVAIDTENNIILCGASRSANFPTTTGVFQPRLNGSTDSYDAIVSKISPDGRMIWSTYYGGINVDHGNRVGIDNSDNSIWFTGFTESSDFPITIDGLQRQLKGQRDGFIAHLSKDAEQVWSSYIGGSNEENATSIATDRRGNIAVSGTTNSRDLFIAGDAFQKHYGGGAADAFIIKFGVCNIATPVITPSGWIHFCLGDSVTLTASAGYSSYLWSNGDTTQSIVAKESYGYTVTVWDSAGCSATSELVFVRGPGAPSPVITALGPTTFCMGDSVMLDAGGGYSSYLWSTGEAERTIFAHTTDLYRVTVTDYTGCTGTSRPFEVSVDSCGLVQCDVLSGIINTYSVVSAVTASTATLIVGTPTLFKAGDQVLLVQMQGATIDTSNTDSYGTVQNLNGAGNYEFAVVKEIQGNNITLTAPLFHRNYDVTGHIQLVTVPQYDHVTVVETLTCAPWNGETGGILAFGANCLMLDSDIDVSGKGFRGAVYEDQPGSVTQPHYGQYISDNGYYWAMKGEGIAGNGVEPFIYGKGSPANGGGGGNNHNGGGGGGAGYGSGGTGGYGYQGVPGSIKTPQGVGGKGLAGVYSTKAGRLFPGGGGGSGHVNHTHGSQGANGGGLAFIRAHSVRSNGTHKIAARGAHAPHDSSTVNPDGCGGGGAGGSIFLDAFTVENTVVLDVSGGNGGSRIHSLTSSGPGGGGAGGLIALAGDTTQLTSLTTVMDGGAAGTEPGGKNYGATNGQSGGRRASFVSPGRMKIQELAECRGCMPVVQQKNNLCGKTLIIVSDAGESITRVIFDEASSSNAIVSIISLIPSKQVTIEVALQEETQAGYYALTVHNGSGKEIAISGEVHPLPVPPVISFDGQLLSSTPAKHYQWYYGGNALYNGKNQTYRPSLGGAYIVRTTDENGCTADSNPFIVQVTTMAEAEQNSNEVFLQPNPVHERLTMRILGREQRHVAMEIRNILGLVMMTIPAQTVTGVYEQIIDVEHLPAGVYFLSITNGRENFVRKFVRN